MVHKSFSVYLSACLIAIFLCAASLTHAEAVPVLSIDKELDAGKDDVTADKVTKAKIQKAYGKLPLYFIKNVGQVDGQVKYYEKGSGHATFFTKDGVYLALTRGQRTEHRAKNKEQRGKNQKAHTVIASDQRESGNLKDKIASPRKIRTHNDIALQSEIQNLESEIIKLFPIGANKDPEIVAEALQAGKVNYFIGNDPEKWRTNIPTYRAVLYKEIYPGIDMKFYGNNRELEYDIIVSPGADPSTVRLSYEGIESMRVTDEGELEIGLKAGKIVQKKPYIYQVIEGKKVEIEGKFKVKNLKSKIQNLKFEYGFELASYDKAHPIIIDPVLVYSTYLGGVGEEVGYDIAVDGSGNAYLTGDTYSTNFPI